MPDYFASTVYFLCFLASTVCAVMFGRHLRRTGARLLFWSAVCFWLLALNNLLLVLDQFDSLPDLAAPRLITSLAAVSTLLFGFIWDVERG